MKTQSSLSSIVVAFLFVLFSQNLTAQISDSTAYKKLLQCIDEAWNKGAYDNIISCSKDLLAINVETSNWSDALSNYYNIGAVHYMKQDFVALENILENATNETWFSRIDEKDIACSNFWNLYGLFYYTKGDFKRANTYLKKSLNVELQQDKLNHSYIASSYLNIATNFGSSSDYAQAIDFAKMGLIYQRDSLQNNTHLFTAQLLKTQGFQYKQLEQYAEAERISNEAIRVFQQIKSDKTAQKEIVDTYINLTDNALKNDVINNASRSINLAKNNFNKNRINDQNTYARILTFEGLVAKKQGQYSEALAYFKEALSIRQTQVSKTFTAVSYRNIGELLAQQKKWEAALPYYQSGLIELVIGFEDQDYKTNPELNQSVRSKDELIKLLHAKAKACRAIGHVEVALQTYELSIAFIDNIRKDYLASGSKYFLAQKSIEVYEEAIELALEQGNNELAFQFAMNSKSNMLLDALKHGEASFKNIPESLLKKENDLKMNIAFLERKMASEKDSTTLLELSKERFNTKQAFNDFISQLEKDYPKYFELKYSTKKVTIEEIQQKLKENTALIEYFFGKQNSYAFSLSSSTFEVFQLGKVEDSEQAIIDCYKSLSKNIKNPIEEFNTFTISARKIFQQLLAPILKKLPSSIDQLIIAADHKLNYIPFQALLMQHQESNFVEPRFDTLHYLVHRYAISNIYSAKLLLQAPANRHEFNADFLGFAPVFDVDENGTFRNGTLDNLVYNMQEVSMIDSILNGTIYLAESAKRDRFVQDVDRHKILHLATHAIIDDDKPLNSRFYFYDDSLTIGEIYALPMHTQLAVLSSCSTADGKLKNGEGIISLARAFMYAGCSSIISSLWEVDDHKAPKIIVAFYKQLLEGKEQHIALQEAQKKYLLNVAFTNEAHPFYWASFIHLGNSEALFSRNYYLQKGLAMLLILVMLFYLWRNLSKK